MFQALKNIYKLLDKKRKVNLIFIQLLVIFSALAELTQVIVLAGFMNFISNYSQESQDSSLLIIFSEIFNLQGNDELLLYLAIACLIILFICSCFALFALWRYQLFGQKIGADLSNRLFVYYMKRDWLFHTLHNSSALTSNISIECVRVSSGIISQSLNLNSRLVMAFTMIVAIFLYDFYAALLITVIFLTTYLVIYSIVEQRMIKNGQIMSYVNKRKFKLMNEGFGGIRDTILLGRSNHFSKSFINENEKLVKVNSENATLSQGPRYITELAAFGTLIAVIIYTTIFSQASLNTILPLLSFFALAGFKLLPAFQQIYYSFTTMQGNIAALNGLEDDLANSSPFNIVEFESNQSRELLSLQSSILIQNLSFNYPGDNINTIDDISLEIKAKSKIGFVGHSGSGKSTMVDIITGLLQPSKGTITVDGEELTKKNIRKWQNNIGFVSQRVFLHDASIKENIAFGLPKNEIDIDKVNEALEKSNLSSFVHSLKEGIDTIVGERGVQLSGGQCQRIGIARALYENSSLLILDEASSSLDGITERKIMEEIGKLSTFKTIIIIAHRINTVKDCDEILFFDNGRIVYKGSYDELYEKHADFRKMASSS
jgi:HlyD family secretion protein|tara:strand:+ start:58 stop:1863 length:1806 start_codon:yes stop_codon:yes gene_type:complete